MIDNEKILNDVELEQAREIEEENAAIQTIKRKKAIQKGIPHGNRIDMIVKAIDYAAAKIDSLNNNEKIEAIKTYFKNLSEEYKKSRKGKEPDQCLRGKLAKMTKEEFEADIKRRYKLFEEGHAEAAAKA